MDKYEHRRQRLIQIRDTMCGGKAISIARAIEREPSYVSRMLYEEGKKGKKRIADDMVELIESSFNLPKGWLDGDDEPGNSGSFFSGAFRVDVLDLTVSAGPGTYMLSEAVEVLNAIEFTNEHAKLLFGNRQSKDIKVMTVDGDSMYPTITSGDRLFFDVSVREFKTDGIYAFVYGKTFHVKRLQMQGLQLAVLSDNPNLEKWYIGEETQDQFYVMGKALLQESIQYNKL